MSVHFHSHLNSAVAILKLYKGEIPFNLFLKKYFSSNKKFGSQDRKQIASLCYNYFRLGHAAGTTEIAERILTATFLSENKSSPLLHFFKPQWNDVIEKSTEEKFLILNAQFLSDDVFPFKEELSDSMEAEKFNKSFLIQPKLFLRIRPGNKNKVTGKLAGAGLSYELVANNCIALSNSSKINDVLQLDKEAVVQDYSSQRVGEFIKLPITNHQLQTTVWDCCAASGGKSLMAYDIHPDIKLTVSDKRESILKNLKQRFKAAGIKNYESFITDLSSANQESNLAQKHYDLIIADVPCTGSGTWSRTPEQLFHFSKKQIEVYSHLQKRIIENVVEHLKPGARLLYITCSVFKKENEEAVNFAVEKFNLILERVELLKGYEMQADTMFAALLSAPL